MSVLAECKLILSHMTPAPVPQASDHNNVYIHVLNKKTIYLKYDHLMVKFDVKG